MHVGDAVVELHMLLTPAQYLMDINADKALDATNAMPTSQWVGSLNKGTALQNFGC
jgi:hypothetical protein